MTEKKSFSYYIWLMGLTLGLFGVSAIAVFTQSMPPKFQTGLQTIQTYDDLSENQSSLNLFFSQLFLNRDKTEISFPFALQDEEQILWVGFNPVDEEKRWETLVSHPQFNNLNWESIQLEEGIYLYQREQTYTNAQDFNENPPDISNIRIDAKLKRFFPNYRTAEITDFPFELNSVDYLITTYKHQDYEDGVYYFKTIIDATNAIIGDDNRIQWYIRAPGLDESKPGYLVGNINVNYIQ